MKPRLARFLELSGAEKRELQSLDLSGCYFPAFLTEDFFTKLEIAFSKCDELIELDLRNSDFGEEPQYVLFGKESQNFFVKLAVSLAKCSSLKKIILEKEVLNKALPHLNEAFFEAAKSNNLPLLKSLKNFQVNIDFIDETYKTTPLWAAVAGGFAEVVQFLLESGADFTHKESIYGADTVTIRVQMGLSIVIPSLLWKYGAGLLKETENGVFGTLKKFKLDWEFQKKPKPMEIIYLHNEEIITKISDLEALPFQDRLQLVYKVSQKRKLDLNPVVAELIHRTALEQRSRRLAREIFVNLQNKEINTGTLSLLSNVDSQKAIEDKVVKNILLFPSEIQLNIAMELAGTKVSPTGPEIFLSRAMINRTALHLVMRSQMVPEDLGIKLIEMLNQFLKVTSNDKGFLMFRESHVVLEKSSLLKGEDLNDYISVLDLIHRLERLFVTSIDSGKLRESMEIFNVQLRKIRRLFHETKNPYACDGGGWAPIHWAISYNNICALKVYNENHYILSEHILFAQGINKISELLEMAFLYELSNIIKQSIESKIDLKPFIKIAKNRGKELYFLRMATEQGDVNLSEALLDAGADPNGRFEENSVINSYAIFCQNRKIWLAVHGNTALSIASLKRTPNSGKLVELFLSRGADPNALIARVTPINIALTEENHEAIKVYQNKGYIKEPANKKSSPPVKATKPPLHFAYKPSLPVKKAQEAKRPEEKQQDPAKERRSAVQGKKG